MKRSRCCRPIKPRRWAPRRRSRNRAVLEKLDDEERARKRDAGTSFRSVTPRIQPTNSRRRLPKKKMPDFDKGEAAKLVAEEAGLRRPQKARRRRPNPRSRLASQCPRDGGRRQRPPHHRAAPKTLEERISQTQAALERRKDAKKEAAERIACSLPKSIKCASGKPLRKLRLLRTEVERRAAQCEALTL